MTQTNSTEKQTIPTTIWVSGLDRAICGHRGCLNAAAEKARLYCEIHDYCRNQAVPKWRGGTGRRWAEVDGLLVIVKRQSAVRDFYEYEVHTAHTTPATGGNWPSLDACTNAAITAARHVLEAGIDRFTEGG